MPKKLFILILFFSFLTNSYAANLDSLISYCDKLPSDTNKVDALNKIASIYLEKEFSQALHYAEKSKLLAKRLKYENGTIRSLGISADAYDYLGKYFESQKYNYQLLQIYEKNKDSSGMASSYNNIGIIHYYLNNIEISKEFTEKSLRIYLLIKDSSGISNCYNNLANLSAEGEGYQTSLDYYFKALAIDSAMKDDEGVALIKGNIGETYTVLKEYDKAYQFLFEALIINEKSNNKHQQANMLSAIGALLYEQNKSDDALNFFLRAVKINKSLGVDTELGELYQAISDAYQQKGDYQKSLHYLQLSISENDKIYTAESSSKIAEMNSLYKIKEKENELKQQQEMAGIQAKQKTYLIVGSVIGFALLLIIVGIFAKANLDKRKANDKLELQKLEIETKSQSITDSIVYAKRIQGAILPSENTIKNNLKNSFIFYRPKDIVAGDFYWMEALTPLNQQEQSDSENKILFAAADCTGHGVPGAMVSVVCNNALNRAVREFQLKEPAKILDKVTELVIETFEQSEANIKDGMDIALCSLNTKTNELEYAGANNSLYLIRDNELSEIKSDKQPIGKYTNTVPFTNHKVTLKENDTIYLFTDGYADQFGGEKGKKFKYKQFKALLLKNCTSPMQNQLKELNTAFDNWKGDLEQIDDVCVIGVRV